LFTGDCIKFLIAAFASDENEISHDQSAYDKLHPGMDLPGKNLNLFIASVQSGHGSAKQNGPLRVTATRNKHLVSVSRKLTYFPFSLLGSNFDAFTR
jgi:hypothetical protein